MQKECNIHTVNMSVMLARPEGTRPRSFKVLGDKAKAIGFKAKAKNFSLYAKA